MHIKRKILYPNFVFNEHEYKSFKSLLGVSKTDIEKAKNSKDGFVCERFGAGYYLSKNLKTTFMEKELTKIQEAYLAIAERINLLRECNWVDISTGVAEVMEKHFEELKPNYNRKELAKLLLKGTEKALNMKKKIK